MRKAISLIEVMISIVLLAVVITSVLQMQQNNLYFMEKFKTSSLYDSYISLSFREDDKESKKKIYLDKIINFNDDDIRKELKLVKLDLDFDDKDSIKLPDNGFLKNIKVIKKIYTIEDKASKEFYIFKLEQ